MSRVHKVKTVVLFMSTRSGIPLIQFDSDNVDISAPFPYEFHVLTNYKTESFYKAVSDLPSKGIPAVIKYDKTVDSVADAVVGMRLEQFNELLAVYNNHISPMSTEETEFYAANRQRGVRRRSRP